MPLPSTMTPIATNTLVSNSANLTFSNIPQTYTDLVLVGVAKFSANPSYSGIIFNGDSGTNYSSTFVRGNGTSASSGRNTTAGQISSGSYSANFIIDNFNIQNYSNATTYKTVLYRTSQDNDVLARVGLWRNTAAITSITYQIDTGNILAGSSFTLYGVKAA